MTDRKWRVIIGTDRMDFYKKIEKYENYGYQLFPNSFSVIARGIGGNVEYFGLMGFPSNNKTNQQNNEENKPLICLNCKKPIQGKPKYCPKCGKKMIYPDN